MKLTLDIKDDKELTELFWLLESGVKFTEQCRINGGFSKAQKLRSARLRNKVFKQIREQSTTSVYLTD